MKFAHLADCHLGSWSNHPDLKEYPVLAFERAMDKCREEKVDFIIIAGDLFDTSLPSIDVLRRVTAKLKEISSEIPVYVVPGSHDYSPTGKTMITVLESAGLLKDVCRLEEKEKKICLQFTTDEKTGTKITGLMGRKGSLEVDYYKNIDRQIEDEPGFKVFVFHAAVSEYQQANMNDMVSVSISDLPKNFSYYATGHVHSKLIDNQRMIVFPGELFPTSFDELESYNGGFVIAERKGENLDLKWIDNRLFDVVLIKISADGKSPSVVESEISAKIDSCNLKGKCLLLKVEGDLDGKASDIDFNSIFVRAAAGGAIIIKKNTSGIKTSEFEGSLVQASSTDEIEKTLIQENIEKLRLDGISDVPSFVLEIMKILEDEKKEDETNAVFEERIRSNSLKALCL